MDLQIKKLDKNLYELYNMRNFTSGNDTKIDGYFRYDWNSEGVNTFVLINDNKLIGAFSLTLETISIDGDYYPAVEIKHFAILKDFQNRGYGLKCIENILEFISENPVPMNFVVLGTDLKTSNFYKKSGFRVFLEDKSNRELVKMIYILYDY